MWDKIKTSNKLAKLQITLTGTRGSKLALLDFVDITCSLRKFTFTKEFAVIKGMVSDMLLGLDGNTSLTSTQVGQEEVIITYLLVRTIL